MALAGIKTDRGCAGKKYPPNSRDRLLNAEFLSHLCGFPALIE
jgi:hypothetical protein